MTTVSRRTPLSPVYADGSALCQYLADGPCRQAWLAWADEHQVVTSVLGITELQLLARQRGGAALDTADEVEASLEVLRFSDQALEVAGHVSSVLSSFVALHLGAAVTHPDVETVATYHTDLARVAALYRLRVVSPGWPDRWWEDAS